MEKELRTIEKQSLQPDVEREGNDSAGAEQYVERYYTVFRCPGTAQPRPRRAQGAGLTARPGRLDAWCGVELAAARVLLGSLLPSLLRSEASPCSSHTSPDPDCPPGPGLEFSRNHTLQC